MASRTKEALIAQFSKSNPKIKAKRRPKFSPFAGGVELLSIVFIAIGATLLVLPFFLPDIGRSYNQNRILSAVRNLELQNELFPGQFRLTSRSGDTRPHSDANFWAVSILKAAGIKLRNETGAQALVQERFRTENFGNSLKEIYQNLVHAKALGSFAEGNAASKKVYDRILRFCEKNSGFRISEEYTPTVEATFYAFEAIHELGKFSDFEKRDEFRSSVNFVTSMQNTDGGFKNKALENSTLSATYYAVSIISRLPSSSSARSALSSTPIISFILSCQARDGGFRDTPFSTLDSNYYHALYSPSSSVSTAQALYTLHLLRDELGLSLSGYSSSSLGLFSPSHDGISYLLNNNNNNNNNNNFDLETSYHLSRFTSRFPAIHTGPFRALQLFFVTLGITLVTVGLFYFIRSKIPSRPHVSHFERVLLFTTVTLSLPLLLSILPLPFTLPTIFYVISYLIFGIFLGTEVYDLISTDTSDGLVFLISACQFFGFTGILIFISSNFAPFLFSNPRIFLIFPIWQAILSAGISCITSYSTRISKINIYYKGSLAGWILNLIVLGSWIYVRGDWDTIVGRMVRVYGLEGYLMVVWPILSLLVVVGSGVAGAYYWWDLVEDRKDSSSSSSSNSSSSSSSSEKNSEKKGKKQTALTKSPKVEETTKQIASPSQNNNNNNNTETEKVD